MIGHVAVNMSTEQLETPVVIIVFKRENCAERSMAAIREVRPKKLYIVADGPRKGRPEEHARCLRTRQLVEEMIDWPCDVRKNYADTNMGCGKRIPSGLDWVFAQEEQAIIVEGDIVAESSFFHFCHAMLEQYRDEPTIMQVCGYNRFNYSPKDSSYFYSHDGDIWGWATWRRAWQRFGAYQATDWKRLKETGAFAKQCRTAAETTMCSFVLDEIFSERLNAWAMRWKLVRTMEGGWSIVSGRNLTKNIGFGADASHTVNPFNPHRFMTTRQLDQPFMAPRTFECDREFERRYGIRVYLANAMVEKIKTSLLHKIARRR